MKSFNIVITEPAEYDLKGIGDYIAKELREPFVAQNLVAKIGATIMELENIPLRNALVSDVRLAGQGIRKLMVDNYIVFYVVSEKSETVTIVRILHGKREWNKLL